MERHEGANVPDHHATYSGILRYLELGLYYWSQIIFDWEALRQTFQSWSRNMWDNLQHNLWNPPIQPVGNVLPTSAFSGSLVQRLPTSIGQNLHVLQCLHVQMGHIRTKNNARRN